MHVQDISAFLPSGYKLRKEGSPVTESSLLSDILSKSKVDISSLLPPNYNKKKSEDTSSSKNELTTSTTTTRTTTMTTAKSVDVSTEKSPAEKTIQDLFSKSKFDISALLPPGYEEKEPNLASETKDIHAENSTEINSTSVESVDSSTTKKPGGLKIVFPSRPGGRKPIHKITTPSSPRGDGPGSVTLKIQKGWPTR